MRKLRDSRDLVQQASQGDLDAVELLLGRHLAGLHGFLRRRAGAAILGHESSADLVQSVCREVLGQLQGGRFEYQGEAQFKQWLYQAALHKIQDRRKYHGARKRAPAPAATPETAARLSDPRFLALFQSLDSPSRVAARHEELTLLDGAFADLTEEQRCIITLARIEGLAHREIAERLGVTEANARMMLSRALARLVSIARRKGLKSTHRG